MNESEWVVDSNSNYDWNELVTWVELTSRDLSSAHANYKTWMPCFATMAWSAWCLLGIPMSWLARKHTLKQTTNQATKRETEQAAKQLKEELNKQQNKEVKKPNQQAPFSCVAVDASHVASSGVQLHVQYNILALYIYMHIHIAAPQPLNALYNWCSLVILCTSMFF